MNIKKRIKKDKTRKNRIIFISIIIMLLIPYMVAILNDENIFKGWELYFAFSYTALVDILLLFYIIKTISDLTISFYTKGQKLKIKDGLFRRIFSLPLEKVLYVDIIGTKDNDFEIFIVLKKGKKNRNFNYFNSAFVNLHPEYKPIYGHMALQSSMVDYFCTCIRKGRTKKYYLLYIIFKHAYAAEFSPKALDYVKTFMEEYNMS